MCVCRCRLSTTGGTPSTFAYGDDLDVALQDLIAVFEELPSGAR